MDPNTLKLLMGSAGAGAVADKIYIEDVFSTYLYTGNGSTQTITNGIDLSGKGGLAWIKGRSDATGHRFTDTIRGATKSLESNSTAAEVTESTGLTSFSSTGFALGSDGDYNTSNSTYVSWTFRKAAKFFDVVTWTAVGTSGNRRISHNLGSVPGCIIIKATNATDTWYVYHRSEGRSKYLKLNSTDASASQTDAWGTSDPTSTDFGFAENIFSVAGWTYVAYLFAHDAGGFGDSGNDNVISCGSLTIDSNGKATADLGWEPQYVLFKRTNNASNWYIVDNMRGIPVGSADPWIGPHLSNAESTAIGELVDPSATGFTLSQWANGDTIIYIAIRRGPMKTPTDATKVFDAEVVSESTTAPNYTNTITSNFPVDWVFTTTSATARRFGTRLTAPNVLETNSTSAEANYGSGATVFASNTSAGISGTSGIAGNAYMYAFRRAPGFFDVVAYTGTGSVRTVSHNLGVAPELIIVKLRSGSAPWVVYVAPLGNTKNLFLNQNFAQSDNSPFYWNNTSPTSSVFSLGLDADVNLSASTYIAYLFATCPGVSKVGSYTGTGTTLQVNCGFTNGARFVLIKRTDSTGDWYVWDTARGIVSGNDPFLLLNSTAAENTSTDYIDPLSTGFEISSTAPAAINANGGSFLFLAVA